MIQIKIGGFSLWWLLFRQLTNSQRPGIQHKSLALGSGKMGPGNTQDSSCRRRKRCFELSGAGKIYRVHQNLRAHASVLLPPWAAWLPLLPSCAHTYINCCSLSPLPPRLPLDVHFYSPSPVLKYYWGLGVEVSWYDSTGSCAPLRKPLIPGCGFQSLSPHCSVNSQQATKTAHQGWKTSHTRKHQVYHFLLNGYWGDVSVHRRTTQINRKGLLKQSSHQGSPLI